MRRREFITVAGGVIAWPLGARAQQPAKTMVGFLSSRSPSESAKELAGFHHGLREAGYVEGSNVTIEYRWAENQYDRLPVLAADLIARKVAVIAATGGPVAGLAVKTATTSIPIPFVFISGADPVRVGLVSSLNRPGGNATGVNLLITAIEAKRLGLLHEMIPSATGFGVFVNPKSPDVEAQINEVHEAARIIGKELHIQRASNEGEIDAGFATLAHVKGVAVLVAGDPSFTSQREIFVASAARHAIPAMYETSSYTTAGGLASYGPSLPDMYRQVGVYVGRILKGEKPADLPVVQPTKIELVINLKAAKALGLTVPPSLLARTDEVIE
jgi:putative ABC transport system substrate-binding protein